MAGIFVRSERAREPFSRGTVAGFLGDNGKGVEEFSRCVAIDARDGFALSLRGYLRGAMKEYKLAEDDHRAALALVDVMNSAVFEPWALQHYADLCRRRGELERAIDLCGQARALQSYPHTHFRLAWIYLDMNRLPEAKAEFATFERIMAQEGGSYARFWRDERAIIERLRKLP